MYKTLMLLLPFFAFAQDYKVAFYSDFEPISYSENRIESQEGFNIPQGYEAELLKAIELIPDSNMHFNFVGVKQWDGIWLKPHTNPDIDIAMGGITYEGRRVLNETGQQVLETTNKTATFKQSLLVKAENAELIKTHHDLNCGDVIGAVRGTTGEYRFLVEADIVDNLQEGNIQEGVVVVLPGRQTLRSDGTLSIYDPRLINRVKLVPPTTRTLPTVRYFVAEDTMIPALKEGHIDAIARGYIGNQLVARRSDHSLAVTATFSLECPKQIAQTCTKSERAVLFLKKGNQVLKDKLNHYIDYLTDGGSIDYEDWVKNPSIFSERAKAFQRNGVIQ